MSKNKHRQLKRVNTMKGCSWGKTAPCLKRLVNKKMRGIEKRKARKQYLEDES